MYYCIHESWAQGACPFCRKDSRKNCLTKRKQRLRMGPSFRARRILKDLCRAGQINQEQNLPQISSHRRHETILQRTKSRSNPKNRMNLPCIFHRCRFLFFTLKKQQTPFKQRYIKQNPKSVLLLTVTLAISQTSPMIELPAVTTSNGLFELEGKYLHRVLAFRAYVSLSLLASLTSVEVFGEDFVLSLQWGSLVSVVNVI